MKLDDHDEWIVAASTLQQWDSLGNCFWGGGGGNSVGTNTCFANDVQKFSQMEIHAILIYDTMPLGFNFALEELP